jgi:hypothetical protein
MGGLYVTYSASSHCKQHKQTSSIGRRLCEIEEADFRVFLFQLDC